MYIFSYLNVCMVCIAAGIGHISGVGSPLQALHNSESQTCLYSLSHLQPSNSCILVGKLEYRNS